MKPIIKYAVAALLLPGCLSLHAQKSKFKSATQQYENYSYAKTTETLLELAEKGQRDKAVLEKLASSFYMNNNMKEASRWYNELFKKSDETIDAEHYFQYALALKGVKEYKKSDKWMRKFSELKPNDLRAERFLAKEDYHSEIAALSDGFVEFKNLDINTEYSDFGTAVMGDKIVFASARDVKNSDVYEWNNQPYLDLYTAKIGKDGSASAVSTFSGRLNTRFHESSVALSKDEKTVYFTRNNYFENRREKDEEGVIRLQLYRATRNVLGQWDNVEKIHFNSSEYSVAHPTLNAAGNRLYFASDMDGTLGASDIYMAEVKKDGSLGAPQNVGKSINTESQESFPFVNAEGDLYYSTRGLPGLGGYDIFVVRGFDAQVANGTQGELLPTNVGSPINSNADDFGFYEDVVKKEGFFSSNREGGKGDDDIYSFKRLTCEQVVEGVVKAANSDKLFSNTTIILFDDKGKEVDRLVSGRDASYSFKLDCNKEYVAKVQDGDEVLEEISFTTTKQPKGLDLVVESIAVEVEKPTFDISKDISTGSSAATSTTSTTRSVVNSTAGNTSTTISAASKVTKRGYGKWKLPAAEMKCYNMSQELKAPSIYFPFGKSDLGAEALVELDKVVAKMNAFPSMMVEVRSHTDCRADASYNQTLSQNRADATRQYMIGKGISPNRLTAKGYGETKPLNHCECDGTPGLACSDFQHKQNRRSEFIVTSVDGQTCSYK